MTEEERRRRRTEEELFLLFSLLARDTRATLQEHVLAYLAGTVSLWSLSDALVTALSESHAHAAYLGRRLAGHRQAFGRADQDFAASVMIEQMRYLEPFLTDLQAGRYEADSGHLAARVGMYAGALRKTAEESWSLTLPEGTMINWVLSGTPERHCQRCPELAAGGPYPANAMPTYPGSGELPCMSNCLCHLETVDGRQSFLRVD